MINRPNQYANNNEFSVVPREQTIRPGSRQQMRLYFIGIKLLRNGKPPMLNIAGRLYQLPPIGEFIQVDEVVGKEIINRCAWFESGNPTPLPGITTDPKIAEAVKAAFESGDTENLDVRNLVKGSAAKELSEQEMLEVLRAKGYNVDAMLEGAPSADEPAVSDESQPLTSAQKAAQTRAAKAAKSKAK